MNFSLHLNNVEYLIFLLLNIVAVSMGVVSQSQWLRQKPLLFKFFWIFPLAFCVVACIKLWFFAPIFFYAGYGVGCNPPSVFGHKRR